MWLKPTKMPREESSTSARTNKKLEGSSLFKGVPLLSTSTHGPDSVERTHAASRYAEKAENSKSMQAERLRERGVFIMGYDENEAFSLGGTIQRSWCYAPTM
jgi:hypothetical protein